MEMSYTLTTSLYQCENPNIVLPVTQGNLGLCVILQLYVNLYN
jgi:hypothetical protein